MLGVPTQGGNTGYQSNSAANNEPGQSSQGPGSTFAKKSSCLDQIEKLKINREERRKRMDDIKKKRSQREANNEALGIKVDVDF